HVRADVVDRVDAGRPELVRPELVRGRDRDVPSQARCLRALRDRAARLPASALRAGPRGLRALLRLIRRVRARRAVRPHPFTRGFVESARLVARLLSTLLVVGLLGGTAAAFAVTEGLKLQHSPITSTHVPLKVFSPVCGCNTAEAPIGFRLRKADRVTVQIVDAHGAVVRTLVSGKPARRGRFAVRWDGRDAAGAVLPEGTYKPRVHLAHAHRTIGLPNPIQIDVTPPTIRLVRPIPAIISPDGDHRHDQVRAFYR